MVLDLSSVYFSIGILLQSVLMLDWRSIKGKWSDPSKNVRLKWGVIALVGLFFVLLLMWLFTEIGIFNVPQEMKFSFDSFLTIFVMCYAPLVAVAFMAEYLPFVSRKYVLALTVLFGAMVLTGFDFGFGVMQFSTLALIVVPILIMGALFLLRLENKFLRAILYFWFLVLSVLILLASIGAGTSSTATPVDSFIQGIMIFQIIVLGAGIIAMFPQGRRNITATTVQTINLFYQKIQVTDSSKIKLLVVLLVVSFFSFVVYVTNIIPIYQLAMPITLLFSFWNSIRGK